MKQINGKIEPWEYEDIFSPNTLNVLHDENFNNKIKIEIEHSLAETILALRTPDLLAQVYRVSAATLPFIQYIKHHTNSIAKGMYDVFLLHVGANSDQFARDDSLGHACQSISEEHARETLLPWLETMLTKIDPSPEELLSIVRIHLAADYVLFDYLLMLNKDSTEMSEEQREALALIVPDCVSRKNIESSLFSNDALNKVNCEAYFNRGRISRNKTKQLRKIYGLFAVESPQEQEVTEHVRGMDLFRTRANYRESGPESKYVDIAIDKDMPMVCSMSTTAFRLLRFAAVLTRMSVKEYWDYALPHLSYNILGGHHTFHEYASVMALVGIPYKDGSYKSLFLESSPVNERLSQLYPSSFNSTNPDTVFVTERLTNKSLSDALLEINQSYTVDNYQTISTTAESSTGNKFRL